MATDTLHDPVRSPEIAGSRITVYNLLPYFLDPTATEDYICRLHDLKPEQVAAARAYALNNADVVLARHLEIEARIAAGNPPEVIEQAKQTRDRFEKFRAWLAERDRAKAQPSAVQTDEVAHLPSFREWLAVQESRLAEKP